MKTAKETNAYIARAKKELELEFIKYNAKDSFSNAKTIKGAGKGLFVYSTSPMDSQSKTEKINKAKHIIKRAFSIGYLTDETRHTLTFSIPQGDKFKIVMFTILDFNAYEPGHRLSQSGYTNSYFVMNKPYTSTK